VQVVKSESASEKRIQQQGGVNLAVHHLLFLRVNVLHAICRGL
jgi:hypothetical protein